MKQMRFNNCVVIGQARVIEGRKAKPHVCTLALNLEAKEEKDLLIRFCPVFKRRSLFPKRWSYVSFIGTRKNKIHPTDKRYSSWGIDDEHPIEIFPEKASQSERNQIHKLLLGSFLPEEKLNKERRSIGIMIPVKSMKFKWFDDEGCKRHHKNMDLYHPDKKLMLLGKKNELDGRLKNFKKTCVAWDVIEAYRKNNQITLPHNNPYCLIGNVLNYQRSWVVVAILSAPDGYIDRYALKKEHQLSFT
tara:strand:+ start:4986 stop:5723 length:738 start_codon:yes stop_codon:yes gene_type:complete